MTKKLYDDTPYESKFKAIVVETIENEEKMEVALDATLFFPLEGGQNPDWGTLAGFPVLNVRIKDGVIWHSLPKEAEIEVGQSVDGIIDFAHRYDLMQQHSGEHVLSGIIYKKYGYENVGFHLTEEIVTVDVSGPLTQGQIEEIEFLVNVAIRKNVTISTGYPDKEELAKLPYRSKKEIDGAIRIVMVGEYDVCACCAPHVKATGEIGSLYIVNWENYKGGVRLEIKCGARVTKEVAEQRQILKQLSKELSAKKEAILGGAIRLKEENGQLKQMVVTLQNELIEMKVNAMNEDTHLVVFESRLEGTAHKNYANLLMEKATTLAAVLVNGTAEDEYRYIIAGKDLDLKVVLEELKTKFQAKGGGKSPMIQGTLFGNKEEIEAYLKSISV